jgi:hypothetical protein
MAFVRCYTGADGQSHFEDLDLLPPDSGQETPSCSKTSRGKGTPAGASVRTA